MKQHIKETLRKANFIQVHCYSEDNGTSLGIIKHFPEVMVILTQKQEGAAIIPVNSSGILGFNGKYHLSDYQIPNNRIKEGKNYICKVTQVKGRTVYAEPLLESKNNFTEEIYDYDPDEINYIGDEFFINKDLLKLYSKAYGIQIHATMQAVFIRTNCNHWMIQMTGRRPALFHENRTRYGISGSGTNGSYHKQFVCETDSIDDYLQYVIMHDYGYKPKNNIKKYNQVKQMYA